MTTRLATDRRAALELPYRSEHEISVQRAWDRGGQPRGIDALVSWLVKGWDLEPPAELHGFGPWFDESGGSALGAPRWSDPFRSWLTASPCALDVNGNYRWPMRSAIYRLSLGGPRYDPRPLAARYLFALGQVRGDWRLLNDRSAYPVDEEILRPFWVDALTELWYVYRESQR